MAFDGVLELIGWFMNDQGTGPVPTTEARLRELGWVPTRSNKAAGWEEWRKGILSGYLRRRADSESFQLVLKILWPEEGADFDHLYESFEREYEAELTSLKETLGTSSYASEFDEPPLPMPGQFDRGTVWTTRRGAVAITFQHEDKEAPMRLSLWLLTSSAEESRS